MTIGGLDVGHADIEAGETAVRPQAINVMGDNTVRARDTDPRYTDYSYTLRRVTGTTKAALVALLDAAAWAATGIAIVDDESSAYTGYLMAGKVDWRRRAGPFWTATITFRRFQ